MHEAGNVPDIEAKLELILRSSDEIRIRGQAARKYVENTFDQTLLTSAMVKFYKNKLA